MFSASHIVRRWTRRRALTLFAAALCLVLSSTAEARTLDTAHGEVEVPESPERIVTLYEGALDAALAAGIVPVGAVTTRGGDGVAGYIEAHLDALSPDARPAIVGVVRELNLEAVLAQRPDLILAAPQLSAEQYALLSRIAPTVVPATRPLAADNWQAEARLYGEALGRAAEVEAAIAELATRSAALAEALAAAGVNGSANLIRWMPQGPMVMSAQLFASGLIEAAGLEIGDAGLVREGGSHSDPLSLENLSRLDGDWLFLATLNAEGQEALDAARTSPAFARLPAVQAERVVPVDGQLWTSANGPLAAQAILDHLEAALLP
ncbi:ABC transporter substrate-binding protein [Halomonas campisalis]|uniref:ABC transporter substrate-binding protein n=1 Tax=Billgrantia campisalis TaxID=74661 RepID=A0ABS9P7L0_9GAMM|nr:ABC transporter substrate-binding protein [Halomonas campisalis]MCG6657763.1 ABC transporter substrate-binding protein [Halomonas campisalis]MDR5862465.1 ABC transporter substrate-binding protein [Halomonas campisalis]